MTPELEMLVYVTIFTTLLWIPYIVARITSAGFLETLTYKADGDPMPEWAIRAKKAHYNSIENLIVFAILVITARLVEVSNDATISASIAYFWLRLAHYPLYVFNVPFGRTLAFAGSWFAQICIGYQVLFTKLA